LFLFPGPLIAKRFFIYTHLICPQTCFVETKSKALVAFRFLSSTRTGRNDFLHLSPDPCYSVTRPFSDRELCGKPFIPDSPSLYYFVQRARGWFPFLSLSHSFSQILVDSGCLSSIFPCPMTAFPVTVWSAPCFPRCGLTVNPAPCPPRWLSLSAPWPQTTFRLIPDRTPPQEIASGPFASTPTPRRLPCLYPLSHFYWYCPSLPRKDLWLRKRSSAYDFFFFC